MRHFTLTSCFSLGLLLSSALEASLVPPQDDTCERPLAAMSQEATSLSPETLKEPGVDTQQWRAYFAQEKPEALDLALLQQGFSLFLKEAQLGDWITLVHNQTRDPKKEAPFSYLKHLINIAPIFASPKGPLSHDRLTQLFPNIDTLIPVGRCYMSLLVHLARHESASQQIGSGSAMAKKTLIRGFETACKHYTDRITQTTGSFSRTQALDITRLVLTIYHSPVFYEFARENSWDQVLIKTVANHTPTISSHEKAALLGFAELAQTEALSASIPKAQARDLIARVSPFLANEAETKIHAMWAFPILANAYYALEMSQECLQTWREFEKIHPTTLAWCHRDLSNALLHLSEYSQSAQEIDAWWQKYLEISHLRLDIFCPNQGDLSVIFNIIDAYVRLGNNESGEFLARKTMNYLAHDGAPLLEIPHFVRRQFLVSLNHARALTNLGRYEEAARIYENHFEWDQNNIYIRMQRPTTKEDQAHLVHLLMEDAQTAVVAFVQSGRITYDPKAHGRMAAGRKTPHKRPVKGAREGISIANAARTHLVEHYTARLDDALKRVDHMIHTCKKMPNTEPLLARLSDLKVQGASLKDTAVHTSKYMPKLVGKRKKPLAQPHTSSSSSSSHPAPTPVVSLIDLGCSIDDFHTSLTALQEPFDAARRDHKVLMQKELNAYFKELRVAEDDAVLFLPTPPQGPSTPLARTLKNKTKKRGVAMASSSTQPTTAPHPELPVDAPHLFMKKQAQGDYAKLDARLLDKFHALAHEIALNPYQIIGGQGRPERLVTDAGIFLSRKLTDGDRVVYELNKDEAGKVRVIFVSLLGHYKHLARQKH